MPSICCCDVISVYSDVFLKCGGCGQPAQETRQNRAFGVMKQPEMVVIWWAGLDWEDAVNWAISADFTEISRLMWYFGPRAEATYC